MFFLPSNDSCSTQSLERRESWFRVWNKTRLVRIEAAGGKTNLQELKERKVSINYPTLPDSQTFQILLVHRPALGSMWWEIAPHVLWAQFLGIHPSPEERLQRAQHSSLWAIERVMTETRTHILGSMIPHDVPPFSLEGKGLTILSPDIGDHTDCLRTWPSVLRAPLGGKGVGRMTQGTLPYLSTARGEKAFMPFYSLPAKQIS